MEDKVEGGGRKSKLKEVQERCRLLLVEEILIPASAENAWKGILVGNPHPGLAK